MYNKYIENIQYTEYTEKKKEIYKKNIVYYI